MPSTFLLGCLGLKMIFCVIPFPKNIVYSDVVLDKLRQRYKSSFPSKNEENWTLKVTDGHSCWQVLKNSRLLNYSKLCKKEIESCLSKKNQRKTWKSLDDHTKYN